MKKKFVVVGAMAGTLIFTQSALAAGLAVTPSKNTLSVQSGEGVQTVSRYFDMQELKQKCEVETTYIDNGGATFVTAHAFDAE